MRETKLKILFPRFWEDERFGKINPIQPVIGISWYEANAYCEWLFQNWGRLSESKANTSVKLQSVRLPLETEWGKAAGGIIPEGRYAWDEKGKETTSLKEILRRANVGEREIGKTTPVDAYPLGGSPYDVRDMSGNVLEWQANHRYMMEGRLVMRGGSWYHSADHARVSIRLDNYAYHRSLYTGFRVMCLVFN